MLILFSLRRLGCYNRLLSFLYFPPVMVLKAMARSRLLLPFGEYPCTAATVVADVGAPTPNTTHLLKVIWGRRLSLATGESRGFTVRGGVDELKSVSLPSSTVNWKLLRDLEESYEPARPQRNAALPLGLKQLLSVMAKMIEVNPLT